MEQPQLPNSTTTAQPQQPPSTTTKNQKKKLPTPQELITHYETQGMDTQQASIKVIDDLQHILFKLITKKPNNAKFSSEASRKLDTVNARLSRLEMKLDSKPGVPQAFAVGVASVAGFNAVWPHVVSGVSSIWSSVKGSTHT